MQDAGLADKASDKPDALGLKKSSCFTICFKDLETAAKEPKILGRRFLEAVLALDFCRGTPMICYTVNARPQCEGVAGEPASFDGCALDEATQNTRILSSQCPASILTEPFE